MSRRIPADAKYHSVRSFGAVGSQSLWLDLPIISIAVTSVNTPLLKAHKTSYRAKPYRWTGVGLQDDVIAPKSPQNRLTRSRLMLAAWVTRAALRVLSPYSSSKAMKRNVATMKRAILLALLWLSICLRNVFNTSHAPPKSARANPGTLYTPKGTESSPTSSPILRMRKTTVIATTPELNSTGDILTAQVKRKEATEESRPILAALSPGRFLSAKFPA
mmetsp:Transcript_47081/g.73668  ORF Transcript_47081/g.73668 Transcript_47081/m.73668 type:complete len:218 (-) Transcript_47081:306-959(-)